MAQQAIFVHGSSVVMEFPGGGGVGFPQFTPGHPMDYVSDQPWTDITGSRTGAGAVFHGRTGTTNTFVFSIPTPAVTFGVVTGPRIAPRASLTKMFVMYSLDAGVRVTGVTAFDGGRRLTDHAGNPVRIFRPPLPTGGGDRSGDAWHVDEDFERFLVENVTMFTIVPAPIPLFWGLGIQVDVLFQVDGTIRFTTAGADFEVQDS